MQAIILAAGKGTRMYPVSNDYPKPLTMFQDETILARLLKQLDRYGLTRIVIITGYMEDKIKSHVRQLDIHTPVIFEYNDEYEKGNNILTLYKARNYFTEDTLLIESDLVFDDGFLEEIINDKTSNLAAVDQYKSWMDGTVVTLDHTKRIKQFISKKDYDFSNADSYFKTINVYKFSSNFLQEKYLPLLEEEISNNNLDIYYEDVFKRRELRGSLKGKVCSSYKWYEIDDLINLEDAKVYFSNASEKKKMIEKRFGGYWRYPNIVDFCYLVNPTFPNERFLDEMKWNFETLVSSYPSTLKEINKLAAHYYRLDPNQVIVGNGASELINVLFQQIKEKVGVVYPTFEEYPNRLNKDQIVPFQFQENYRIEELISHYSKLENRISYLLLINPDNPTGYFHKKKSVLRLLDWAKESGVVVILDESFIDFASSPEEEILSQYYLDMYSNLVIIKSISKSYGVAGIRLGILATSNHHYLEMVSSELPIWNINAFAEFFLQELKYYKEDYEQALLKHRQLRQDLHSKLEQFSWLKVYKSEANYIMCECLPPYTANKVTEILLYEFDIYIKDLSGKNGLKAGEYIRIAVKGLEENMQLYQALQLIECK